VINIKIEVIPFDVPDSVRAIAEVKPRQDGFSPTPTIPLCRLTQHELSELCIQFRKDVFKKAQLCDPLIENEK